MVADHGPGAAAGPDALLGRRRSWLLLTQVLLAIAIFAMGQVDPTVNPWGTALIAVIVAFLSASQDIVIDAYRIEFLPKDEQGHGAAATQIGYRFGLLLAGAGAVGFPISIPGRGVRRAQPRRWSACGGADLVRAGAEGRHGAGQARLRQWVKELLIDPFADFMSRTGWVVILLFVLFYKFGDALGGTMANPFYIEMGYTGVKIATVSKIWGIWMTIVGALIGGIAVARWGVFKALLMGGILQAITNFAFAYVALEARNMACAPKGSGRRSNALVGTLCAAYTHDLPALTIAITADNIAGGRRAQPWSLICPACAMSPSPPRNMPC